MALSAAALRQVGIQASPDEMEALVLEALARMMPAPEGLDPRRELTAADAAALERGGFSLDPVQYGGKDDPVARGVALYTALLASSLSVAEAAALLHVDPSRVRQRLAARTLYGVKESGGWRIPRFQFDGPRALPGIDAVLPRLDPGLHPVAVYNWFTEADPDLVVGDTPLSPRDWLRAGRPAGEVAAIAADL